MCSQRSTSQSGSEWSYFFFGYCHFTLDHTLSLFVFMHLYANMFVVCLYESGWISNRKWKIVLFFSTKPQLRQTVSYVCEVHTRSLFPNGLWFRLRFRLQFCLNCWTLNVFSCFVVLKFLCSNAFKYNELTRRDYIISILSLYDRVSFKFLVTIYISKTRIQARERFWFVS